MWGCFFLFFLFWYSCTSYVFSALLLTSKRGLIGAQCQSDGWGQRSCRWLVTWMTLPVCSGHVRASATGFSQITHSSMSLTHYRSPAADVESHKVKLLAASQYFINLMCILVCVYPSLPTDVAETVYSVGAKDDHGWTSLLHIYNVSFSEAQKGQILFALSCSTDPNKLHR